RQPAVLGEHRGVGLVELGADLLDDRALLGSRHLMSLSQKWQGTSPQTRGTSRLRERLVRRAALTREGSHYLEETGGLWLDEVVGGTRRLYYCTPAACSSAWVMVGSILTPGPIVELVVTVLRYR